MERPLLRSIPFLNLKFGSRMELVLLIFLISLSIELIEFVGKETLLNLVSTASFSPSLHPFFFTDYPSRDMTHATL